MVTVITRIPILARGTRLSAGLFVPYALGVSLAATLNATPWWLNR